MGIAFLLIEYTVYRLETVRVGGRSPKEPSKRYRHRNACLKHLSEGIPGMAIQVYPSDLTDAKWALLAGLLPADDAAEGADAGGASGADTTGAGVPGSAGPGRPGVGARQVVPRLTGWVMAQTRRGLGPP